MNRKVGSKYYVLLASELTLAFVIGILGNKVAEFIKLSPTSLVISVIILLSIAMVVTVEIARHQSADDNKSNSKSQIPYRNIPPPQQPLKAKFEKKASQSLSPDMESRIKAMEAENAAKQAARDAENKSIAFWDTSMCVLSGLIVTLLHSYLIVRLTNFRTPRGDLDGACVLVGFLCLVEVGVVNWISDAYEAKHLLGKLAALPAALIISLCYMFFSLLLIMPIIFENGFPINWNYIWLNSLLGMIVGYIFSRIMQ